MAKLLSAATVLTGAAMMPAAAQADVSYNVGFASEYYYRGYFQKSSSASAGIDFEEGGFYAGAWTADVGDGLEVDGYLGDGVEMGDLSLGVGFTGYYYTGDFDNTYEEINFNVGYGPISVEYSTGTYDDPAAEQDYSFLGLSADLGSGFSATYGSFGQDFAGAYFQGDYGFSVAELDLGVSLIFPDDDIGGGEAIVFSVGKSF
ncbi:MAG: TorF family putative porin [Pseudomonadota bacterium]|nr:TorF family putative porin [Pseudomonadota bacterium]